MPVHNTDVAQVFNKVADLLDIEGANQFRIRAYRNAARTVSDLPQRVADMVQNREDLSKLPGIGKDLAGKIQEIVETGSLSQLKELQGRTPAELDQLMQISTLGPKRVRALHQELGIENLKDLEKAAREGHIKDLEGFGEKTQQAILEEIQRVDTAGKRIKLMTAEQIAEPMVAYLKKAKGIKRLQVAGSYRRRKETVGDLDILVSCKRDSKVMDHFVTYEDVSKVVSKGSTRSTVVLRSGLQVDLRVVPDVGYGAALHYFTGSKAHNIAVRKLGVKRNLKINEYGVFRGEDRIAGKTEEGVYEQVDLPYIEPELRENWGEIEAAGQGALPDLLEAGDIQGDLHAHTKVTDGRHSIRQMADAARDLGYEYLAVTEHSKRVTMAKGLDKKGLARLVRKIDQMNKELEGFRILKGIEVDILKDGSLDLPDEILKKLDLTVCSVHYDRNMSGDRMTERIIRAMDDPYFNILAHPTGRLIGERDPYDVDLERVMEAAKEYGCFLEVNAHPDRLDLSDKYCKMAKEMGLRVAVSTDAHSLTDLDLMRFGVDQARRGWLEKKDVLNTLPWKELKKELKRG